MMKMKDEQKMKTTVHNIQNTRNSRVPLHPRHFIFSTPNICKVAECFENLVCINVINKSASSFKTRKTINER